MGTELMTLMREFCGWLSADVPALHTVEVPILAASLDRFFAVRHLCMKCGRRMTYTATAPIADAPMEWRCFACRVDLGSVGGEHIIEIDNDGVVSEVVIGPIRDGGPLHLKSQKGPV